MLKALFIIQKSKKTLFNKCLEKDLNVPFKSAFLFAYAVDARVQSRNLDELKTLLYILSMA